MVNAANEMGVFERVIERGSFAAAAQDVGLSPSAVSKLIMRLEQRLGVRLINRTTRRLALTAEGTTYLKRSREILAAIEAAESEIASARMSPRGHLRVHAPPVMIGDHFGPALSGFLARYPRITIDFLVTNRAVDLVAENVDIAMRTGKLPELFSDSLQDRRSHADYLRQSRVSGAPRSPACAVRSHAPSMFDSQRHSRTDNLDVSW